MTISKFVPSFLAMAQSKYGHQIIEKSLNSIIISKAFFLLPTILDNFMLLACSQYGVKILKIFVRSIIYFPAELLDFEELLFSNIKTLINHEYGNYLIQSLVDVESISYCSKIVTAFDSNLLSLAMSKYSFNVLDKLIDKLQNVSTHLSIIYFS